MVERKSGQSGDFESSFSPWKPISISKGIASLYVRHVARQYAALNQAGPQADGKPIIEHVLSRWSIA